MRVKPHHGNSNGNAQHRPTFWRRTRYWQYYAGSLADIVITNRLGAVGGGVVVYREGRQIALIEMPIAGLMSDQAAPVVAQKAERLVQAMAECGCHLHNAFMQFSLLALVVIPELCISDLGLVDVREFKFVDVVI